MLVKIADVAAKARAAGFKVYGTDRYLEIFAPEHAGPYAVNWHGSVYSRAKFIVSDTPHGDYGYNCFFYGPWHEGMTQDSAYGVRELLAHPAML